MDHFVVHRDADLPRETMVSQGAAHPAALADEDTCQIVDVQRGHPWLNGLRNAVTHLGGCTGGLTYLLYFSGGIDVDVWSSKVKH